MLQQPAKTRAHHFFWADVEQFNVPLQQGLLHRIDLLNSQRAVEKSCGDAVGDERRHLISHKRDQGAYDNRYSFQGNGRNLIAKALAPTRRHEH